MRTTEIVAGAPPAQRRRGLLRMQGREIEVSENFTPGRRRIGAPGEKLSSLNNVQNPDSMSLRHGKRRRKSRFSVGIPYTDVRQTV
jgi:hypothetical protein